MDEIHKIHVGKLLKKTRNEEEMTWTCTIFRFLNYFRSLKKHKSYYNFSFRINFS